MSLERLPYRADIDGVRGLAILAVLVFHAFPGQLPAGFFGVDVFFVVSGYLITGLILSRVAGGEFTVWDFYRRRVVRLFPALVVVLAACYAFGWVALFADEFRSLSVHLAAGAGFVSNFLLLRETGYFDHAIDIKPLAHLWSLAVEEQFYLIWPWCLWLIGSRRSAVRLTVGAVFAASLAIDLVLSHANPSAAFYLPIARSWELMAGAALALSSLPSPRVAPWLQNAGAAIALALLGAVFKQWVTDDVMIGAILTTIAATLAIVCAGSWINRTLLANRAIVGLGLISYPLYLWHWPLLSYLRIVSAHTPSISSRLVAIAAAFALAWLTYRFVERPLRFGALRAKAAARLAAGMAVIAVIAVVTYQEHGLPERFDSGQYGWTPAVAAQVVGPDWRFAVNQTCEQRFPFEGSETFPWWFCVQSSERPPTIVLIGTSHANQLYAGLAAHPALAGHSILSIGTCYPIDADPGDPRDVDPADGCSGDRASKQQQFIDGLIARTPSIAYVIFAGLPTEFDDEQKVRLARRAERLTQLGKTVIVFEPDELPTNDIRSCFARPFRAAQPCDRSIDELLRVRAEFRPWFDGLMAANGAVKVFQQNDALCDATGCHMIAAGLPLYRDEYAHLSEYGSRLVADRFVNWAREQVPGVLDATTGRREFP